MKVKCNKAKEGFTVGKEYRAFHIADEYYMLIGDNGTMTAITIKLKNNPSMYYDFNVNCKKGSFVVIA